MDFQNPNTQSPIKETATTTVPQPAAETVVCRVCMHVNPAGTTVCRMCANDLGSDEECIKRLEAERLVKEAEAKARAEEEARKKAEAERLAAEKARLLAEAEEQKRAEEAAAAAEPEYVPPVFEDDEEPVVTKAAEKLLKQLDVAIARYKMQVDAYERMKEREKTVPRIAKLDRKIQKLTRGINRVIADYRRKLLRQKYDLPLYDWETTANA